MLRLEFYDWSKFLIWGALGEAIWVSVYFGIGYAFSAQAQAIADTVKRLAMAEPHIRFTLTDVSDGGARSLLLRLSGGGPLADFWIERGPDLEAGTADDMMQHVRVDDDALRVDGVYPVGIR